MQPAENPQLRTRQVVGLGGPPGNNVQSVTDAVERRDDLRVQTGMTFPVAPQRTTSLSLPVATSKTKPRNDSCLVTNGLFSMRRSD